MASDVRDALQLAEGQLDKALGDLHRQISFETWRLTKNQAEVLESFPTTVAATLRELQQLAGNFEADKHVRAHHDELVYAVSFCARHLKCFSAFGKQAHHKRLGMPAVESKHVTALANLRAGSSLHRQALRGQHLRTGESCID